MPVQLTELRDDSPRHYLDSGAQEFTAAPDGQRFTFVARGNVFLMNKLGQVTQVTRTPEEERDVTFSPDGQSLAYSSARWEGGKLNWRLYRVALGTPHTPSTFGEARLTSLQGAALRPVFSPDGQKIAFLYERREVRVLSLKTGKVTPLYRPQDLASLHFDDTPFDAGNWSPDSRTLLVPWRTNPDSVINRWAIVPADGSAPPRVISPRLAETLAARFSGDGTIILATTTRDAPRTLDGEALSVNGRAIPDLGGLDAALDGLIDQEVSLRVLRSGQTRELSVQVISPDKQDALNLGRVAALSAAATERLSAGKLAYTFLPQMDTPTFINVYNDLLGLHDQRAGAVLDIRGNQGGNLAAALTTFLSGQVRAQAGRNGFPLSAEPANQWTKPSAVMVDTKACSDGSIFPLMYQDAHIGPVVGEAQLNTGTAIFNVNSALLPGLKYQPSRTAHTPT